MILFWGSKGYQKVLGHTQTTIECGHCNNADTWEISETGRKFTLYWIPLFPYGKTYTQLFSKSNLVHCLLTVDFKTFFSSP